MSQVFCATHGWHYRPPEFCPECTLSNYQRAHPDGDNSQTGDWTKFQEQLLACAFRLAKATPAQQALSRSAHRIAGIEHALAMLCGWAAWRHLEQTEAEEAAA